MAAKDTQRHASGGEGEVQDGFTHVRPQSLVVYPFHCQRRCHTVCVSVGSHTQPKQPVHGTHTNVHVHLNRQHPTKPTKTNPPPSTHCTGGTQCGYKLQNIAQPKHTAGNHLSTAPNRIDRYGVSVGRGTRFRRSIVPNLRIGQDPYAPSLDWLVEDYDGT